MKEKEKPLSPTLFCATVHSINKSESSVVLETSEWMFLSAKKKKLPFHIFIYTDIEFNSTGDGYFPILYINDYWNLAQEYTPLNDTVKLVM